MKNYQLLLMAALFVSTSCSVNNNAANVTDSTSSVTDTIPSQPIYAVMQIRDSIKTGEPLELRFTVHNDSDTAQQFLRWDTPFEPLVSKYLDVKDENGVQVDYRGAMAKRMMPPPADNYITVNAGDSLPSTVDLLKGYAITKPSRYTIVYVASGISGLVVKDSVSFVYGK